MIVLDNLIYRRQHSGEISTVWYELTKRIIERRDDYLFLEYAGSPAFNHLRASSVPERLKVFLSAFYSFIPAFYSFNSAF